MCEPKLRTPGIARSSWLACDGDAAHRLERGARASRPSASGSRSPGSRAGTPRRAAATASAVGDERRPPARRSPAAAGATNARQHARGSAPSSQRDERRLARRSAAPRQQQQRQRRRDGQRHQQRGQDRQHVGQRQRPEERARPARRGRTPAGTPARRSGWRRPRRCALRARRRARPGRPAAGCAAARFSRSRRTMFSTSMIASSTTSPSAITRPASTIVLSVPPRQCSTSAAASSDSGIAVRLMSAVRQSKRNSDQDRRPPARSRRACARVRFVERHAR